ncbi:hypothetical protein [Rhizobacter sp. Root1221]|uniref:hypothetical protein n=1 Tax=Rhizobacter sp. Root1221 TaxID=1736433 RepID=UPI0006FAE2C0|nr:hypothetical protein [Rhizobacter sp. Root1221]KQV96936.1 hypothetical protein ASC87_23980 [Rhizobacter sp. Root1221]
MSLPDLAWQVLYGRFAWAIVAAAAAIGLWAWWQTPSRRTVGTILLLCAGSMALPGAASPAHWLGLAFQWPSALCVALSALTLGARWRAQHTFTAMPTALAAACAGAGALLYLDACGWLAIGLYFAGFGPNAAPMAAVLLAAVCAVGIARHTWRWRAAAVLAALMFYMVFRLPTGNLWDTLLDPFLWGWSVLSLIARWRASRRPVPLPALAAGHPAP